MGRDFREALPQPARLIAMRAVLTKVANGAERTVRLIGQTAAWSGLALVLLVAFNVLARYLFSYGTVALQEAEWHLMAVAALFGISYGLNQGAEVRVDVLYEHMGWRQKAAVDLVANLCLLGVALIVAWLCLGYVQSSYAIAEGSPDPGGLPYRYLLKAALPISFAVLALQALAMTCRSLLALAGPR